MYGRQQGVTGQFGIRVFDPTQIFVPPNTTSAPTTTPTTRAPVTAAPTVTPATDTPIMDPVTSTPTMTPATDTPTMDPATDTPTMDPATDTPTITPATSTPSVFADSAIAVQFQSSLNRMRSDADKRSETLSVVAIILSAIAILAVAAGAVYMFIMLRRQSKAEPDLGNGSTKLDVA